MIRHDIFRPTYAQKLTKWPA